MNEKNFKVDNKTIVLLFKEVLAAMEVKEVNRFRIRAYQNVIASVDNLTIAVYDLWKQNRLDEIPGVGSTIKQHFDELFTTGTVQEFNKIRGDLPQGMFSLIGLRGVGAKKAFKLAANFNLNNRETALSELKELAQKGRIRDLEGFGEKSEKDILEAVTEQKMHKKEKQRVLYADAEEISKRLTNHLEQDPYIKKVEVLGSFRRKEATIGDLDVAVSTSNSIETVRHFLSFDEIGDVLSEGDKGARVVLNNGLQIDLRVIDPKAFGSMLQYFTGSKIHNVALRTYALEKGMSLSEYGIKVGATLHEFDSEEKFYEFIGLPCIPPELRQGKHEIESARSGKLPNLVELSDIKGDLHLHTTASDGLNTLEEMADALMQKGYLYAGITDHAPSVRTRGEKEVERIIKEQRAKIEKFNKSQDKITIFLGYEVNILSDATLGMPDEFLSMLDYTIASIHTNFDQPEDQITERYLAAVENKHVKILGHPLGRLINQRDAMQVDWQKVFRHAQEYGTLLEINSQPDRLDLSDDLVLEALRYDLRFVINTDSHNIPSLDHMKYGINIAKRGWCSENEIANTLALKDLKSLLGIKS